jgi:release factor glutamine methyltransferase
LHTYATDISSGALRIAKKNAQRHGVDITFLRGNLLQPLLSKFPPFIRGRRRAELAQAPEGQGEFSLVITANLPYLTQEQFNSEPSIQDEPPSALVAGNHGLALYEELFKQIRLLIVHCSLFLEIDPSQSATIRQLISQHCPNATVEIKTDLRGQDRVVCIETAT